MPALIEVPLRPDSAPRHNGWTLQRKHLYLAMLRAGHSVARACARVGLSRQAAYQARRRDPAFARDWRAAQDSASRAAAEALLANMSEPVRRALVEGAASGDFHGASFSPQDPVISVNAV